MMGVLGLLVVIRREQRRVAGAAIVARMVAFAQWD